jgi:hypothetical protein
MQLPFNYLSVCISQLTKKDTIPSPQGVQCAAEARRNAKKKSICIPQ